MHLLDTNTCIKLLNGSSNLVIERFVRSNPASVKLCSVVKAELFYGARHSQRIEENLALLHVFFKPFESLAFDDRAAEFYGIIREDLSRSGNLIGPNDLIIASIARVNDLVLVTRNSNEFRRVPNLRIEDWEKE